MRGYFLCPNINYIGEPHKANMIANCMKKLIRRKSSTKINYDKILLVPHQPLRLIVS